MNEDIDYHGAAYWHGVASRNLELVTRYEKENRRLKRENEALRRMQAGKRDSRGSALLLRIKRNLLALLNMRGSSP